jgi:hypothetical protein
MIKRSHETRLSPKTDVMLFKLEVPVGYITRLHSFSGWGAKENLLLNLNDNIKLFIVSLDGPLAAKNANASSAAQLSSGIHSAYLITHACRVPLK